MVAGHFTLDVQAIAGRDIGKAREGSIEGSFVAPLVQERVAEKNLALLNAAATTDVAYTVTVTDSESGETWSRSWASAAAVAAAALAFVRRPVMISWALSRSTAAL